MQELAPGVWLIPITPLYGINAYLLGETLVDAGVRPFAGLLSAMLKNRPLRQHVLTHAHPDHQGASHAICEERQIPLCCGECDANQMEQGQIGALIPPLLGNRILDAAMSGPAHPVARRLREGDMVGDFVVIDTPGHSPGHIALWRESDRVLIAGDVLANQSSLTLLPGLREPYLRFTCDPVQNRASIRKIAALRPSLVCFGHGPPLRDLVELDKLVGNLPDEP